MRFPGLTRAQEDRVRTADLETLDGWAERILGARTLDDIFE